MRRWRRAMPKALIGSVVRANPPSSRTLGSTPRRAASSWAPCAAAVPAAMRFAYAAPSACTSASPRLSVCAWAANGAAARAAVSSKNREYDMRSGVHG